MTHIERKLLIQTAIIGAGITLLVVILQGFNQFDAMEGYLYHLRARYFQFFTPPPTDQLVHLDIDDAALETVGAWPWPRSHLAQVMDELTAAGAAAVAWDVQFIEPQAPRFEMLPDNRPGRPISDDALFAEAVARAGNVLLPLHLTVTPVPPPPRVVTVTQRLLRDNLQLTQAEVAAQLSNFGIEQAELSSDLFNAARREAMYNSLDSLLRSEPNLTFDEARERLLPGSDSIVATVLARVLEQQYERVRAMLILDRFTLPAQTLTRPMLVANQPIPPILPLAGATVTTGFVDHVRFADGVVRSVPLWATHRGRMYPQLGMSLACLRLGIPISDIQVHDDYVLLPRGDQPPIVLPTHTHHVDSVDTTYGGFMALPWWGPPNAWTKMYDFPAYEIERRHIPLNTVWTVIQTRQRIDVNLRIADDCILGLYQVNGKDAQLNSYIESLPQMTGFEQRQPHVAALLEEFAPEHEKLRALSPQELEQHLTSGTSIDQQRKQVTFDCVEKLLNIREQTPALMEQLHRYRAELRQALNGKAVLIGWTATGAIADFVPTSLHASCPGVVVHGVIFNSILSGDLWEYGPNWLGPILTLLLGLLTTVASTGLSPGRSAVAMLAIAAGWIMLNGLLMFDRANLIVEMGAPLLAIASVWTGCTVVRFIIERAERARITRRFSTYVDPALVNYVIEHPEQTNLAGQERELTVVFTDLAGFTTISERLKAQTVPLLNEYMGLMVPVIRDVEREPTRRGYVNKFLGDGIMFFFGAPYENTFHAADAVSTVLKMQRLMPPFNERLRERGLPEVKMRAGIATGPMVVGDAGPPDASDYTVLGDTVNLAARLEGANKATGTLIMINERTMQMLEGVFLVRPLANLQVKGKSEGVMTYEPLAYAEEATAEQHRLAELTRQMVDDYREGRFFPCIQAADQLDAAFGPSRLTELYRETCRRYLVEAPQGFRGQIVLTEK